jgi:hypothetical protein
MKTPIKIGQTIAGKYELIKALQESHLYQWIGAVNLKTQKAHTIQILVNDCQKGQIKEAFDYFDALKNVRREGIIPPEQVISNNDLPLVIIHPESFGSILDLSKNHDLDLILKYLSEASELLHIVNNKKLIHGQINPKSFVLKDNKVYLIGFGYAPFLLQGNTNAIKDCGDFLPPEITDANSAQKSRDTIDTYAFAKTVAYWFPNICTSAWYLQATNPDRNQRFKRMRNLFEELKKALTDIFSDTAEVNDTSSQIEIPATEPDLEPQTSGGIIPKHILEIELDPPEAGRVEGGGKYAEGRQVNVKAISFPDWEFVGWDGDILQSNNSLDLVIEKNLKITARYKKIPKSSSSIQIDIYPSEAQEFVTVTGTGCHQLGTNVSIHARSISDKWSFSRWTGDINVSTTPFTIALTSDIRVVAEFAISPDVTKPQPYNKKLGNAFGQILSEESAKPSSSDLEKGKTDTQCVNNEIPEVTPNKSNADEQTVQKQKTLGSAFITTQTEEEKLIQPDVKQPIKKHIVGSAFGESK